jgi:hypothetical protein
MSAIVVKAFNGLRPISDPVLLANEDAQVAQNVLLNSGAMRPMNSLTLMKSLVKTAPLTIYRYDPDNNQAESAFWLEFAKDTDIMRSPIAQDQWNRLYWTDAPNGPRYAPETMVLSQASDGSLPGNSWLLGVPKPTTPPDVTDFGAVESTDTTTRTYCLTFVNGTSGKESPPGPTWTVAAIDGKDVVLTGITTNNQGDSGVTAKRLYRKVPDPSPATTSVFRRITELPIDTDKYTDKTTDAAAALLPPLPAAIANAPTGPKYPPLVSAGAVPANSSVTPLRRNYFYVLVNGQIGTSSYRMSKPSPLAAIMADDSQTVTISNMVNVNNEAQEFAIYRQDTPTHALPLFLTQLSSSVTSYNDPVGLSGPGLLASVGLPATDGPTIPPEPVLSVNVSTAKGSVRRVYMITYVSLSGEESVKSPESEIVEVLDGVTEVAIVQSEPPPTGASKKRLYRQDITYTTGVINLDDTKWKFVAENTVSATKAVDKIADADLPGGEYATALQNMPPTPVGAPKSVADVPANVVPESRVYCYTFVTAYDEEGPPSPSSKVISCDPAKPVTLVVPGGPGGPYNLTKKRIYRSATGTQQTKFQYVGEMPIAVTTFVDNVPTSQLSEILPSEGWIPPPVGLQGLRLMANGAAVGFVGNSLYFSEPNFPHAWPHEYPIDDEIIGIGVFGQSVAVLTRGYPYVFTGIDPEAMASSKMLLPQSCTNKRSIVETGDGVIYASPDGLTMIGQGASLVTQTIASRAQWQVYNPKSMESYIYNGRVLVLYENDAGRGMLVLDMSGSGALFTTSNVNAATAFTAGHYSAVTDTLYFARGGNIVRFDDGIPLRGTWRSKLFRLSQEDNFGFAKVLCKQYVAFPIITVYANGVQKFQKVLEDENQFRLPSGFRETDWMFEIEGIVEFTQVALATSSAELQAT